MIHRLILLDRNKSIGKTLYDDGTIDLNHDLLIGLIQALMLLGETLGESKGLLREAELGKMQLAILSKDYFAYAIIQDSIDNEAFSRKLLDGVLDEFHDEFKAQDITRTYKNEDKVKDRIKELLTSMVFPKELLPKIRTMIDEFMQATHYMIDTLFLSDLDDGIIEIFHSSENKKIIKILLEILSEISFDRQWIGESKLFKPVVTNNHESTHEVWILHRIGLTDFVLVGRAYYSPGVQRETLVSEIEKLSDSIQNLLLNSAE